MPWRFLDEFVERESRATAASSQRRWPKYASGRLTSHVVDGERTVFPRIAARLTDSILRDMRFLKLPGLPRSDRLRLIYEKYASRLRAALGLAARDSFQLLNRPFHVAAATDVAVLQRVLVDAHNCLGALGLLGEANITAVDVGAHNGETTLAWSIFLDRPSVLAFEPHPVCCNNAQRNLAGVDARVYAVGLSDHNGEAPFDDDSGSGGDATFALEGSGRATFASLPVARGDDVLAGLSPDLVKIDVEGYERHVVDGLKETLGRSRFLTIEVSLQRPKDHGFHEIATALAAHHFELVAAGEPHGKDPQRPTAIDLHFRRLAPVAAGRRSAL